MCGWAPGGVKSVQSDEPQHRGAKGAPDPRKNPPRRAAGTHRALQPIMARSAALIVALALRAVAQPACDMTDPTLGCIINTVHMLVAGDNIFSDPIGINVTAAGALVCPNGTTCDLSLSAPVVSFSNTQAPTVADSISITATAGNFTCTSAVLQALLGTSVAAGKGTPTGPGPAGQGLGASHAGAGGAPGLSTATTYGSVFSASTINDLKGSVGGSSTTPTATGSQGGGAIVITVSSPTYYATLTENCTLVADGSPAVNSGAGSGGAIVINANLLEDATSSISASGGQVTFDGNCASPPCGFAGGGGIVIAQSRAPPSTVPLVWATATGGSGPAAGSTVCGGSGVVAMCNSTGCVVNVPGTPACATVWPSADGMISLQPTPLACLQEQCTTVTVGPGAWVTTDKSSATFGVAGLLSATGALFSSDTGASSPDSPSIRAGKIIFTDVAIFAPISNNPLAHAWSVAANGSVTWSAAATAYATNVTGSLMITSFTDAVTVNWQKALIVNSSAAGAQSSCSDPLFDPYAPAAPKNPDGALIISSNTTVTLEGIMAAANVGVFAQTDVVLGPTGASVTAVSCAPGYGRGNGRSSTDLTVGGGGSHLSSGGFGVFSTTPVFAVPGQPNNLDPINTGALFGGSGGGTTAGGGGGWGGGTITLAGNGTLRSGSGTSALFADGYASGGDYKGGSGSGGSILFALSGWKSDNGGDALKLVSFSAKGGDSLVSGTYTCSGAGAGGYIIFATNTINGVPTPAKQDVSGGAGAPAILGLPCGAGGAGLVINVGLPLTASPSMTPSAPPTPPPTTSPTTSHCTLG